MKAVLRQQLAKRIVLWLLAIAIAAYIITGFGITEYRIVEGLTSGLLTKPLAFKIHNNLLVPFLILLLLHIYQRRRTGETNSKATRE